MGEWIDAAPLDPVPDDLPGREVRVRVWTEPSGLHAALPVVLRRSDGTTTHGYLAAWARRPGEPWSTVLIIWLGHREDYRGRKTWAWRWSWCVYEPRRIWPADRRHVPRRGALDREGLSVAIRRAFDEAVRNGHAEAEQ